jgi:putative ABC transport system permease protein
LCLGAFVAAILLVQIVLPVFNRLANKELSFSYLLDGYLIAVYAGLFLVTGLLAGFYPALILSGFNPAQVLYGRFSFSGKNYLQKGLVVLQFGLASFLIIGTVVIYAQFHFLTTEKLGYDDKGLVLVNKEALTRREANVFRDELMRSPDILGVAAKDEGYSFNGGKINGDSGIAFANVTIDERYLPLLKIPIVQGRNFSSAFPMDSSHSVIVNESFVKKAGWTAPIGQQVDLGDPVKYTVVGVVKDYHFETLAKEIDPELLSMRPANDYGVVYIKLRPGPSAPALQHIEQAFHLLFPTSPYSYLFKDQENYANYAAEAKWKQVILFGSVLTIFISCIGLFGLSVFAAERRRKEIGIRKVLGASVASVAKSLSIDFVKLVGISLVLSAPLAWYAANKWLENYPYRIGLGGWMFLAAGVVVVGIALLTVSFQAVRAGRENPANSLRNE